jgi:hypothetical protein
MVSHQRSTAGKKKIAIQCFKVGVMRRLGQDIHPNQEPERKRA